MIGDSIIENARKKIKDFIIFETEKVYLAEHNGRYPDFSNDEEVCATLADDNGYGVQITVSTVFEPSGRTYKDVAMIVSVSVALDDTIHFKDSDDNDYCDCNLSTDELAEVCNRLETKYLSCVK